MAKSAKAAVAPADTTTTTPVLTDPPGVVQAYQNLYDTLGKAYWEASDLQSKDTVQGVREAIYNIITNLDETELQTNTSAFLALVPSIKNTNNALKNIQTSINNITKNISTAASVVAAIGKVLSITGAL
jgi:hypothetical protein